MALSRNVKIVIAVIVVAVIITAACWALFLAGSGDNVQSAGHYVTA